MTRLTVQRISSYQAHELHRVKMLMPALCKVKCGKKVIQWGEHCETADSSKLILFPAGYDLNIGNYPSGGRYVSDILYIPPDVIQRFNQNYPSPLTANKAPKFCLPFSGEIRYCWQQIMDAFENEFSYSLLEHIVQGILLTLKNNDAADILLYENDDSLVSRCRSLLMLDPGKAWTASLIAAQLNMATSTFHRRLAHNGTRFQEVLDDVRLGNALNTIQTTQMPIGEIARANGYHCPSRFTARFQKRFQITPRALRRAIKIKE